MYKRSCFRDDNEVESLHDEESEELNETLPDTEIQSGEGEKDDEPPQKRQRFELGTENQDFDWELPSSLVDYLHKYIKCHVSDKDVKEKVLIESPVPTNIKPAPELDAYIKNLLQSNSKHLTLKQDKTLKSLHDKVRNIFGPMSKLWAVIDSERDQNPNDDLLEDMGTWFEQTVLLTSQLFNSLAYHRRENILLTLMSTSSKVHEILKDQSSSMDSVDNKLLFGEDFEANLLKESKALKKSESLFTGLSNKSSTSSSSTSWSAGKLPFRKGPLFQGRGRGQQSVWKSPNFYQGKGQERGKRSFSFHKTDNRNTSLPIFKGTSNGKVSFFSEGGFKYHPSRESRGVHRKLESSDTGLSNFKHDQGIQNSLCIKASSSKYSFPSKSGGGGKFASGSRDPSNASQRCNKGSRIHTGPISQLNFSSAKKGFRTETCNKSKEVEQLYPIPPFQNGECFSSEGNTSERGPYVQNRPQRCILFSSSSSRLTEICKVSVEGQAISIPLPVFWTGACTKKFYQNNESSSSSFEKTQYKVDNIFRRHIDTSFMSQRDGDGEGHSNICPYPSGLYNKFSKVSCSTYPQDQIFRGGSRLNESKVESSHGESGTNYSSVRNSSGSRESYDKRCHAIGRSTLFSSHSSSSGTFTISSNSKTTDTRVIFSEKLRVFHKIVTRGKGRTGLVGAKSPPVKWTTSPSSSTATNNFNRCLQAGLGSSLQGLPDRGTVVSWGENVAHKYSGVESSKASTLLLSPYVPINKINSLENRQYSSIDILEKDGGDSQQCFDRSKQTDLGVPFVSQDHDYCRVPTGGSQRRSGHFVQECEGLQRVDVRQTSVSRHLPSKRDPLHGSVCFEVVSPSAPVFFLEDRPLQHISRCISGMLDSSKGICVSTVFSNRESTLEGKGRSVNDSSHNTSLADTSLVSSIIRTFDKESNNDSATAVPSEKSSGASSSSSKKSKLATSGLDSVRGKLQAEGISEKASNLILSSRRDGTTSHYESSWRKWSGWCSQRKIHPFRCPLADILEFLSVSFEEGLEYNTIAGYRSALSAYHEPIDGLSVGSHPLVSKLIAGIFNKRPPKPRYTFIWDVTIVVSFLATQKTDNISDKQLTLKLAMLLALTSSARAHELSSLDPGI